MCYNAYISPLPLHHYHHTTPTTPLPPHHYHYTTAQVFKHCCKIGIPVIVNLLSWAATDIYQFTHSFHLDHLLSDLGGRQYNICWESIFTKPNIFAKPNRGSKDVLKLLPSFWPNQSLLFSELWPLCSIHLINSQFWAPLFRSAKSSCNTSSVCHTGTLGHFFRAPFYHNCHKPYLKSAQTILAGV